ncbi:MAG TPA: DUF4954 family protein, partial [Pirellulaceae bacterium]|nr:DUF4954 family protein [Pirellulaceae bacterium]
MGAFRGSVTLPSGLKQLTGVYHATLQDCTIGDDALVRNLRQGMARYDIEAGAVLCDLGCLVVDGEATFGNGLAVHVLREDGELPVVIYDGLSSNIAALLAMSDEGGEPRMAIERLIADYVDSIRSRRGRVEAGAMLIGCDSLTNLRVGPAGRVIGATRLHNVSINSRADSPTEIGHGVSIADSIVADGAHVDGGAIVTRCFVGQGVRMGKHYSATDSLFFANSEAYHGEACSLFAGPYSVTHHKSTLLIAARTAFFNAGAGTTQCNHAYKTGPAHYGVLERGCKTGGASVVCWPANVGAFTTVLGKHSNGFDTREFPFSYLVDSHGHT